MTRLLLDTDICIHLLRKGGTKLLTRMRRHAIDDIAVSSITFAELRYGVARSDRPGHHELLLAQFFAPIGVLPFDQLAAACYGTVRATLESAGTPIGPLDTLIASHALSLDVTLVTANEREFRRVPKLRVVNWLAD